MLAEDELGVLELAADQEAPAADEGIPVILMGGGL